MSKNLSNNPRIDTLLTTRSNLTNPVISFDQNNILGRGVEVTFNFPTLSPRNDFVPGFQALSAAQQSAIRDAMDMISSFVDVTFREVSSSAKAEIEYAIGTLSGNTQGLASSLYQFTAGNQYGYIRDATVSFDTSLVVGNDFDEGSRFYYVAIHEIGHALGLEHPFEGIVRRGINEDTASSVMAYDDGFTSTTLEPSTLMRNDFLALQYLYGENTSTFAGDTVHSFTNEDFRGDGRIKLLWDASGNDTIDLGGITSASSTSLGGDRFYQISLTAGDRLLREPSSSTSFDNVFIADGAVFENAVGTDFDDRITGTSITNRLEGGNGTDRIEGGFGTDTLLGGAGNDRLHGSTFDGSVIIVEQNSSVDINGWLYQFVDLNGNQSGQITSAVGQPFSTFLDQGDLSSLLDDNSADALFGDAGDDILMGGGGEDNLVGGTGDDILTGGASADEFRFAAADGNDMITDFNAAEDVLALESSNWGGTLTAAQIVDTFGTDTGEAFVFDFGATRIELWGDFTQAELAQAIEIF